MDMKAFIDARFIVPPLVIALFVFLADPHRFLKPVVPYSPVEVIAGAGVLFAVGFVISSIMTAFFVNTLNLRSTLSNTTLTPVENELKIWRSFHNVKYAHELEQLHKRWHAFNANANLALAMVFGVPLVLKLTAIDITPQMSSAWTALFLIASFSFIFNALRTFQDVRAIANTRRDPA